MKKLFIVILLMAIILTVSSQKPQRCLFAYVSEHPDEFEAVIEYVESLRIKVISSCQEEGLIFVQLIEKYKDPTVLFKKLERAYSGKCYYKSDADIIIQYDKCKDVYVKKNLKNKKE